MLTMGGGDVPAEETRGCHGDSLLCPQPSLLDAPVGDTAAAARVLDAMWTGGVALLVWTGGVAPLLVGCGGCTFGLLVRVDGVCVVRVASPLAGPSLALEASRPEFSCSR